MVKIVRFPAYRVYDDAWVEVNDAVMATLVSLELAKHTLETVSDEEKMTTDLFPEVEHIRRMHLSVGSARKLLAKTNSHLAAMAIPYVLSLHEDYMMTCLRMLQKARLINSQTIGAARSESMHEKFESASTLHFSLPLLEQFHLIRLIRNSFIHNGGIPSADLVTASQSMSASGVGYWEKISHKRPAELVIPDEATILNHGEILATLAITKNLSNEANGILQSRVPKEVWSDIFQEDFENNHSKTGSAAVTLRKATKYAKQFYDEIGFTDHDLQQIAGKVS